MPSASRVTFTLTLLGALLVAACSATQPITQTSYQRAAGDGASLLAAAAETLEQLHADPPRLTREYAQSALANYSELFAGVPEQLEGHQGGESLAEALSQAAAEMAAPCLEDACDWSTQARDFRDLSERLSEAAE
jgi:hypothetical protein